MLYLLIVQFVSMASSRLSHTLRQEPKSMKIVRWLSIIMLLGWRRYEPTQADEDAWPHSRCPWEHNYSPSLAACFSVFSSWGRVGWPLSSACEGISQGKRPVIVPSETWQPRYVAMLGHGCRLKSFVKFLLPWGPLQSSQVEVLDWFDRNWSIEAFWQSNCSAGFEVLA